MDWEILKRGYAAIAVEDLKKNSKTRTLSKRARREWIENAGMARLAVEKVLGRRPRRFAQKRA